MRIAFIRLSALGDVAMTVPVVCSAARQYPDVEFVVVTQAWLGVLYEDIAPNVSIHPVHLHDLHKGWCGLWRLARELRADGVMAVADAHDVLRTKFLRLLLRLWGCRVVSIGKGRSERRRLIRLGAEAFGKPRRHQTERYADVLRRLGLDVQLTFTKLQLPPLDVLPAKPASARWIGVAPTAAHASKIYSSHLLLAALRLVMAHDGVRLFFFGREASVAAMAAQLETAFPQRVALASDYAKGLRDELRLMQGLDVMLSMDSGNMHLASIVGTPVVSIWGATHPSMGFLGYGQPLSLCLQSSRVCRPCTAYGARPRCHSPYPCLEDIQPEQVANALLRE